MLALVALSWSSVTRSRGSRLARRPSSIVMGNSGASKSRVNPKSPHDSQSSGPPRFRAYTTRDTDTQSSPLFLYKHKKWRLLLSDGRLSVSPCLDFQFFRHLHHTDFHHRVPDPDVSRYIAMSQAPRPAPGPRLHSDAQRKQPLRRKKKRQPRRNSG